VICWGLVVGPLLLGILTVTGISVFSEPSFLELVGLALGGAFLYGLPLGLPDSSLYTLYFHRMSLTQLVVISCFLRSALGGPLLR
jgi:hypothetical protein